jgi:hypothetical protein
MVGEGPSRGNLKSGEFVAAGGTDCRPRDSKRKGLGIDRRQVDALSCRQSLPYAAIRSLMMTRDEYDERKRLIEEQHRATIELIEAGRQAQLPRARSGVADRRGRGSASLAAGCGPDARFVGSDAGERYVLGEGPSGAGARSHARQTARHV